MSKMKKTSICTNCGKKFWSWYSSYGKYCSNSCQRIFQNKVRIKKWEKGEVNPINSNGLLSPWARRFVFLIHNNMCDLCGWNSINQFTKRIPLEVDHIDGDYSNNRFSNLRLLCPNCHSLTQTYKNSNKGHGRQKRKVKVLE